MTTGGFKVFRVDERDSVTIIAPLGDAISFRGADVHGELKSIEETIDKHPSRDAIFDLGSVNYFGSIMIGMIISMAKRVNEHNRRAVLAAASTDMLRLLNAMQLCWMWAHFPTVKEALKTLKEADREA